MRHRAWLVVGLAVAVISACAVGAGVIDDDAGVADATSDSKQGGDAQSTLCNGQPVDLQSDKQNCGKCGNACPPTASCTYGTCQCPGGQTDCNGQCTNVLGDLNNCGKCGTVCQSNGDAGLQGGGAWGCEAGSCAVECTGALSGCSTGCYDLTKDDNHCGNCGTACTAMTCCSSSCSDTTTDNANCGNCGTACATGQACSTGHCCVTADTWCTSACTNTNTDKLNCGKCGNSCSAGYCDGGACCETPGQGTCVHSLCNGTTTKGLKTGCDPGGCVTKVCAADSYCCTNIWDTICVSEVVTYCAPLSCGC